MASIQERSISRWKMKGIVKRYWILYLLSQSAFCALQGQGIFQNLGFNSGALVSIPGDPYDRVAFAPALPGWTGYVGEAQQTAALYNNYFLNSSGIGIFRTNASFQGHIDGEFTLLLQAGYTLGPITTPADTSISQIGLIPPAAQSIQFKAQHGLNLGSGPGDLVVTLGGDILSLTSVGSGGNYTLYGADVRNWAGRTAELRFTVLSVTPNIGSSSWFLDSIVFSTTPIPEPRVLTLVAFAAFLTVSKCLSKVRNRNFQASRPMQ